MNTKRFVLRSFLGAAVLTVLTVMSCITALAMDANISFSDPSAAVGEEVSVTLRIRSEGGEAVGDANLMLNYDASALEFVSGDHAEGGAGSLHVTGLGASGDSDWRYALKFKALKGGTTNITVSTAEVYDGDGRLATISHQGSSAVQISGGSAGESEGEGTEGGGETAAGGEGSATLPEEPVTLTYNGTEYEVAGSFDSTLLPAGYEAGQYSLNGQSVMAGKGADEHLRMLYLFGGDGSGDLFLYDETSGELVPYVEVGSRQKTVTLVPADPAVQVPDTLVPNRLMLNEKSVNGWVGREDNGNSFCVFYGMNQDGQKNFYRYDLEEKTLQRYFNETPPEQEDGSAPEAAAAEDSDYQTLLKKYRTRGILLVVLAVLTVLLALLHLLRGRGGEAPAGREKLPEDEFGPERRDAAPALPAAEDEPVTVAVPRRPEAAPVPDPAEETAAGTEEADEDLFEDLELFEDLPL